MAVDAVLELPCGRHPAIGEQYHDPRIGSGRRKRIVEQQLGHRLASRLNQRLVEVLEDADFFIPGQIVADIALARPPVDQPDGAIMLEIEALTVAE